MFNVKWGYSIKEVQNLKTTSRKSWPGNLFQVMNLFFDPCFKVKWGHHTYFTIIIGAMASEYKDRPSKVLAFKFWPYFEKLNGSHSQLLKNH